MTGQTSACVVLCAWLMASGSLLAHHSLAGVYDMKKEAEVAGTLTKIQFVNPHGSMTIAVKNPDGSTTDWVFTTGSATTLAAGQRAKSSTRIVRQARSVDSGSAPRPGHDRDSRRYVIAPSGSTPTLAAAPSGEFVGKAQQWSSSSGVGRRQAIVAVERTNRCTGPLAVSTSTGSRPTSRGTR